MEGLRGYLTKVHMEVQVTRFSEFSGCVISDHAPSSKRQPAHGQADEGDLNSINILSIPECILNLDKPIALSTIYVLLLKTLEFRATNFSDRRLKYIKRKPSTSSKYFKKEASAGHCSLQWNHVILKIHKKSKYSSQQPLCLS